MLLRDDTLLGDSVVSTVSDAFSIAGHRGGEDRRFREERLTGSRWENTPASGASEFWRPALSNHTGGFVAGALHVLDVGAGIHMRFPRDARFATQFEHA